MDPKIAGALFGLIIGAAGYVIVKFWIIPIRDYRRLKSILKDDIAHYLNRIAEKKWDPGNRERIKKTRKAVSHLNDAYNFDLPVWYKIMLKRRGESPMEAEKHLMSLADIKNVGHAEKRLENAKAALLIQ